MLQAFTDHLYGTCYQVMECYRQTCSQSRQKDTQISCWALHLKTMLLSRLVSFHKGLVNSPKFTIRFLARLSEGDMRTTHGKSLNWLAEYCNIDKIEDLTTKIVKRKVLYCPRSEDSAWKITLATELLHVRNNDISIEGFSDLETNKMLHFLCTEWPTNFNLSVPVILISFVYKNKY